MINKKMERIVIEVADATAKKWRDVSPKIKNHLEKSFAQQIEDVLQKVKEHNFETLLKKAREEAAKNGLSEEVLQQLLNEE
jgi:uncharacterized protein YeaO (DUF488 family)